MGRDDAGVGEVRFEARDDEARRGARWVGRGRGGWGRRVLEVREGGGGKARGRWAGG